MLWVAVLGFVLCVSAEGDAPSDGPVDVIDLNDANFDEVIRSNAAVIVEFYAPWCGHCKSFAPDYNRIGGVMRESHPTIKVAKVDGDVSKGLSSRFDVKGFPTILLFQGSTASPITYEGDRTVAKVVAWAVSLAVPPQAFSTAEEFQRLKDESSVLLAGVFGKENSDESKAFRTLCGDFSEVKCAQSVNAQFKETSKDGSNSITIYRKGEPALSYPGAVRRGSKDAMRKWVAINAAPLAGPVSETNQAEVDNPKFVPSMLIIHTGPLPAEEAAEITAFAREHRQTIRVFVGERSDGPTSSVLGRAMFSNGENPAITNAVVIFDSNFEQPRPDVKKFKSDVPEATKVAESARELFTAWKSNTATRHIRSEAEPTMEVDEVKTLVGTTLPVVTKSDKHVFVMFYAPWCGHCKTLAPTWTKLAKKAQRFKDVVIARFDAVANEVTGVAIDGYPSLYFYPKDHAEPVKMEGQQTLDNLLEFVDDRIDDCKERIEEAKEGKPEKEEKKPKKPKKGKKEKKETKEKKRAKQDL